MKRKEATVLYCNRCRMTTPHAIAGNAHTCKRCGTIKTVERVKHRRKDSGVAGISADHGGHWN